MQAAAHAAAAAAEAPVNLGLNPNQSGQELPDVPDGLASPVLPSAGPTPSAPGLRVAVDANGSPVLWQGAGVPMAGTGNQNKITIAQTQQEALLEWQTFDIGKNTSLTFDQSAGGASAATWIAFNFVRDPSVRPSQILGALNTTNGLTDANGNPEVGGQIYVMNANGIIFGGSSQINAHSFVASSLPINANLIQLGLLNNSDEQFLFSAIAQPAGNNGPTPAFNPSVASAGVTPAQTPLTASGGYGDIVVQPGAQITAPTNSEHVGGLVALIGPNVTNAGTINTPDGQAILAAGLEVGLTAHNTADASLRGLDVYVGAVASQGVTTISPSAGTVTNADATIETGAPTNAPGLVEAPRADVTFAGAAINQLGTIDSSTSVTLNGRIDLLAEFNSATSGTSAGTPFYFQSTGSVVLGPASLTQILPELASTDTVVGASLALPSQINIWGGTVTLLGADASDAGATLLAPNANLAVNAGSWRFTEGGVNPATGIAFPVTGEQFIYDGGQITLDSGAVINVAGSEDVSASVKENIISVQLLGPQLANSPLQRNGVLRGQTIQVDIRNSGTYNGEPWVGTPLADTTGYIGLIQHDVGELTTNGGNVSLNAGGAVVLQGGSSIDVSGGWIDYQGGYVQTTKLLSGGQIVDISNATPNIVYQGIYTGTNSTTDAKWGVTTVTTNPVPLKTFDPSYAQGGAGGSLEITAPTMTLSGNLVGQTFPGSLQIKPFIPYLSSSLQELQTAGSSPIGPQVWELDNQPMPASLSLTFERQYLTAPGSNTYDFNSPTPPDIFFQSSDLPQPSDPRALVISPDLVNPNASDYGGFGYLTIDDSADNDQINTALNVVVPVNPTTNQPAPEFGTITVGANPGDPNNITIQTIPGGKITFDAANIDLEGGVLAPGGNLSFTAHDFWEHSTYSINMNGVLPYNAARGNITVAAGATLSTAGLIVDDRMSAAGAGTEPLVVNGGSITLAGTKVNLDAGSIVDVNGGALIGANGGITYGSAGAVSLRSGEDPSIASIVGGSLAFDAAGQAVLPADAEPLQGFSGNGGGSLSLQAPLVQIGNNGGVSLPAGELLLPGDFFSEGGFSAFTIIGLGRAETDSNGNAVKDASGDAVFIPAVFVAPDTQIDPRVQQLQILLSAAGYKSDMITPPSFEYTPVSLTLDAVGVTDPSQQGLNQLVARGDLLVGAGAEIKTDPQINDTEGVNLLGQTIAVLGSVVVPGGSIDINDGTVGGNNNVTLFKSSLGTVATVDLGPQSFLSTAGLTVLGADPYGNLPGDAGYINTGSVLPGGSIAVSGNIVVEAGARLDVSGWSDSNDAFGLLNLAPSLGGSGAASSSVPLGLAVVPTVVSSNAGSITFTGNKELVVDSTYLKGAAGGPTSAGGSLTILSNATNILTPLDPTLLVTASAASLPVPSYIPDPTAIDSPGQTAIGHPSVDAKGNSIAGMGFVAADQLNNGGFDSLALKGTVSFQGPVDIAIGGSLAVGDSGIILANGPVILSAPYVALGQPYQAPISLGQPASPFIDLAGVAFVPPVYGSGTLTVSAGSSGQVGLIDVGNLSLQQIGQTSLVVEEGDIRGFGTLDVAGSLSMTAAQIYPPTATTFTISAYDYQLASDAPGAQAHPGSVTFALSGGAQTPLSAGGTLNVYASTIDQGGNLKAPVGTINLGWNGSGSVPIDPITNKAVPVTNQLILENGSTTSVSASLVDSSTGLALPIPYGLVLTDNDWIDPTGTDITSGGLPGKQINLSAATVKANGGAVIDTSGGGDLNAYQFVPGVGGTNDILSPSAPGFAVIPGYGAAYAPDSGFNSTPGSSAAPNLALGDLGYTSVGAGGANRLSVGDQIDINLGNGQGVQAYTLLPARFALLPGAFLVTPEGGTETPPSQVTAQPDGSYVVAGYRFNAFNPSQPLFSEFNVAPAAVVQARAQYTNFSANSFFGQASQTSSTLAESLPVDAGQLTISATAGLAFEGTLAAQAAAGGKGGLVDISGGNAEGIVINDSGTGAAAGTLYLSSAELTSFNAGNLLIGGSGVPAANGTSVIVTAPSLEVANDSESPLEAADLILVANQSLTIDSGAFVESSSIVSGPSDTLLFGQVGSTGNTVSSGNGVMLRVSSNPSALSSRVGVTPYATESTASGELPALAVMAGAQIMGGGSVTLDSTFASSLDPTARITGETVNLDSGRIGLQLGANSSVPINAGLVLAPGAINSLESAATSLSLLSYSSINTYGTGQIGALDGNGRPLLSNLTLHAGEILGDGNDVTFNAKNILLDNSSSAPPPTSAVLANGGTLTFNADTGNGMGIIELGAALPSASASNNLVTVDGYSGLVLQASGGVILKGSGGTNPGLVTPGTLTINTPLLTGAAGANQVIAAGKALVVEPFSGNSGAAVEGGLGASLTLQGTSVDVATNGEIMLPSGTLVLDATGSNAAGGSVSIEGTLDARGTAKIFNGQNSYTNGGQVSLTSENGNVDLSAGAYIGIAAESGGGDPGSLSVSAPNGTFTVASVTLPTLDSGGNPIPTLDARNGQGGIFSLDASNLSDTTGSSTTKLSTLETALAAGGFSQSQNIRVGSGDVAVDGTVSAQTFDLSTDKGSIDVTGKIDASGATGGNIDLSASGSVSLESGSNLSVRGINFDDAGAGGSISLEAGSYVTSGTNAAAGVRNLATQQFGSGVAVVDVKPGSTIDLSVVNDHPVELDPIANGPDGPGSSISVPVGVSIFLPSGTPGNDQIGFSSGGKITTAAGVSTVFAATALTPYLTTALPGSTVTLAQAGTISFAGGSGGSIPVSLPYRQPDGSALVLTTTNVTDLSPYYTSLGTLRLSAPQILDKNGIPYDVQVSPIDGMIEGLPIDASIAGEPSASVVVEGLQVFDLSPGTKLAGVTPGVIDATVQYLVQSDGANFAGGIMVNPDGTVQFNPDGTPTIIAGHSTSIVNSLVAENPGLAASASAIQVRPGAEIVNPKGNLTLSTTWDFTEGAAYSGIGDPSVASNWDLSSMIYRFGPNLSEPGFLTLRASGNLIFGVDPNLGTPVSLNDGFAGYDGSDNSTLWLATLLPAGSKSWAFNLVSGADFSAADIRQVLPKSELPAGTGSVQIGLDVPNLSANPISNTSEVIVTGNFQTVRTGTGDIDINSGGNVQLLNNLATIYTAGTQTAPVTNFDLPDGSYPAQYTSGGGNVTIVAQGDIEHLTANGAPDSSSELPSNWLYRRGLVNGLGQFDSEGSDPLIASTSWWTDFSNFFEGVGAFGGGNVTLEAGSDIINVDAVIPTNERTGYQTTVATAGGPELNKVALDQPVLELGGGDLVVDAGNDINGGVYYVERGTGELDAGGSILTNSTRGIFTPSQKSSLSAAQNNSVNWLPTTLFLGQGSFTVSAADDVLLGPVANPFLLPQGFGNGIDDQTYFSTFATSDSVSVSSLAGTVTLKDSPDNPNGGSLYGWYSTILNDVPGNLSTASEPWLGLVETPMLLTPFTTVFGVAPPSLYATSFNGDIDIVGSLTLSPSTLGEVDLASEGSINGLQPNAVVNGLLSWGTSQVNLSDADPSRIPGVATPLALSFTTGASAFESTLSSAITLQAINGLFAVSGSVTGVHSVSQAQDALHAPGLLHVDDTNPVRLYAETGDISGLTLYAGKSAQVVAGRDITDIALYVQNDNPGDITEVIAGRNVTAYDPASALRVEAQTEGNALLLAVPTTSSTPGGTPTTGDIQIGGPGTLEVLAGGDINLGVGPKAKDGTSVGITSIGNAANPYLPFEGSDVIAAAGIDGIGQLTSGPLGLAATQISLQSFIDQYLDPATAGANAARYLPELASMVGVPTSSDSTPQSIWNALLAPSLSLPAGLKTEAEYRLALDTFYLVLRDAGRDRNNPASPNFGTYASGYAAIEALFPSSTFPVYSMDPNQISISLATREIATTNGGDISLLAPLGTIVVGQPTDAQTADQGILTENGGNISIFAQGNVNVGTSRIFTLSGGNAIIWSTLGNIAAGSSSKTVFSAPPTRVLVDPQSANIENDLAGLATGGGIGVLATLAGVAPGSVDLIAPVGTVDAGDAGIRASGSINISALHVLNATNIQAGGTTTGVPVAAVPNIGGLAAAASTSAASASSAAQVANQQAAAQAQQTLIPSIITVEVLGYGGGDDITFVPGLNPVRSG